MARPKPTRHGKAGKLGILLKVLIVVAGIGIFMLWRPIGELVPSASIITASAKQMASDAVGSNGILNSILTAKNEEDKGSDQSGGQISGEKDGSDYVDYVNDDDEKKEDTSDKEADTTEDDNNNEEIPAKLSGSIAASEEDEALDCIRQRDAAKTSAAAKAALPKVEGPFFTCPDGRIGLHVIHMPLLLGQTMEKGAAGVFMAGRMIMFRDFALPSLARQTNQNFVAYVSYDPDQDSAFTKAGQEALKTQIQGNTGDSAFIYVADNPYYFKNKPDKILSFPRVANLLAENQVVSRKDVKSVSLYVTSKMDSDDAVHIDSVKYIQEEACARVGPEESERVLALRIGPKVAWFPHANTTYGVLAKLSEDVEPDQQEVLRRQLAAKPHLQSVAIDVSLMLCQSPLNCYTTTGEDDVASIFTELMTAEDCPFDFHSDKNILDLEIKGAVAGALYSRPPKFGDAATIPLEVEFSLDLLELDGYTPMPFELEAITGCGILPGELSATNLLLASVYAEAPYVSGLSSADAQGWGAVGGMVAAPAPPSQGGEESNDASDQQGDGMDEEETAILDAGSMDEDHEEEQEGEQNGEEDYDTES